MLLAPEPASVTVKLTAMLLARVAAGNTMLPMSGGVVSMRNAVVAGGPALPRRSVAAAEKLYEPSGRLLHSTGDTHVSGWPPPSV